MTTFPRLACLGALLLAGCQGAPSESASTTALEEQCKHDPAGSACKELMKEPQQPPCNPSPPPVCDPAKDPNCKCADGTRDCLPPSPCEPGKDCQPAPCDPVTGMNCAPSPCDPNTGKQCPPPPCDATSGNCPQPAAACVCAAVIRGKSSSGEQFSKELKLDLSANAIADVKQCGQICQDIALDVARQLCAGSNATSGTLTYVAITLAASFGSEQLPWSMDATACGAF